MAIFVAATVIILDALLIYASCPLDKEPLKDELTGFYIICDDWETLCPVASYRCVWNDTDGNGTGMCCPEVSMQRSAAMIVRGQCPLGSKPLKGSNGQLVRCVGAAVSECSAVEATFCYNGARGSICCVRNANHCPIGHEPFYYPRTFLPLVCSPRPVERCPSNFKCTRSRHPGGPYTCCRPTTAVATGRCPAGYKPLTTSTGSAVACLVGGPDCPPPSQCSSAAGSSRGVCCSPPIEPLLQCSNGYALPLDGSIVSCVLTAAVNQCPPGSTCRLSQGSRGVCCRSLARCPAGYSEVLDSATRDIAECPLDGQVCPAGSQCLPASTTLTSLCCQPNIVNPDATLARCPNGFDPLVDPANRVVTCDATTRQCVVPQAVCLQSVNTAAFVCCTMRPVCPSGMWLVTLAIGAPQLCDTTAIASQCPPGSSCERTANSAGNGVCCRRAVQPSQGRCPSGYSAANQLANQPSACSHSAPDGCGNAAYCLPAMNTEGLTRDFICCEPLLAQCPVRYARVGGVTCDPSNIDSCRYLGLVNAVCLPAIGANLPNPRPGFCCQPSPMCANNRVPYYDENYRPTQCVIEATERQNECPVGYICEISTTLTDSVSICCPQQLRSLPLSNTKQNLEMIQDQI